MLLQLSQKMAIDVVIAVDLKMLLPDCIPQELRNMMAIQCRDLSMVKKAEGADEEKQKEMHCKSFHGTESHMSVLDLMLKGNGPCFAAFEKVPVEVN